MEVYLQKNVPSKRTKKSVCKSKNKAKKSIDFQDRDCKSAVGFHKTKCNGKSTNCSTPVLETFSGNDLIQDTTTDSKIEHCSLSRGAEILDLQFDSSRIAKSKHRNFKQENNNLNNDTENNDEIDNNTDLLEDELVALTTTEKSFEGNTNSNQTDEDNTNCQEIPLPFPVKIIDSKSNATEEIEKKSLKLRRKNSKVFSEGEAAHTVKRFTGLYTGPYFDPTTTTNITTQLGTHAYLPCRVKQLGNKSVSWIRRRDAHILTVDRYTFIADDRFQAFLVEATDTWTLQVKYVQARDAGQYECQVSTEPKMSHFITLNVVVPKIEILGESDIYVKSGSTVTLKCVITQSLEEPAYIFWYHDGERVLNYDRSVIDIRMERVGSDTTVGTLIIYHSLPINSGNYTCSPSNLDSASVLLHVLNGEHPAAMQRGKNSASPIPGWSHLSMGLGLAACTSPRFAFAAAVTLAAIFQLLST